MTVIIVGLDEWKQWTRGQVKQFDNAVKKAVYKRGHLIERDAKKLAPVGDTGDLRSGINTQMETAYDAVVSTSGAYNQNGIPYAAFQEYGTSRHGAQPFMSPALKKQGPKLAQDMEKAMGRIGK